MSVVNVPSQNRITDIRVEEGDHGVRLDLWLPKVCIHVPTRSFAAAWIDGGHVLTSRGIPKPGLRLRSGDLVSVDIPEPPEAALDPLPEAIPLRILSEDDDVLVINKQPGLVVHPGAGVHKGTLVNAVLAHCGITLPSLGSALRAGIVHRLDRETSGVMVVAKSQAALSGLSQQFARHEHKRTYLALCYGDLPADEQRIETGYGRDVRCRTRFAALPLGQGRRAATVVRSLEPLVGGRLTLAECRLDTGRTHQIRVHMSHVGNPLVGDQVYGKIPDNILRGAPAVAACLRRLAKRQMLHALRLGFRHPVSGAWCDFEAPLEADFGALLVELGNLF